MIKKILLSLSVIIVWLTSFWYCADSYTCSYKWIINDVSNTYWNKSTYYMTNCNNLWNYYDCSVFVDVSTSNWNCYQIWWFDLNYFSDVNITVENGWSYITFSNYNNNLDQLNGYIVCNPSRFMVQGRVNAYVPDLPFYITTIQESYIINYSYTYTCQSSSCDYSSYENTINTLSWNLATCEWMYNRLETDYDLLSWNYNTCVSDLNSCMNNWWISWDVQWSSLFINDDQVLWNKNIFINIPFDYEYSYTNEWEDFELDIVWLNYDEDYIAWIITTQNSKPSKSDLNYIISSLLPLFVPWLVIILFIYFVFKFIKKAF